jgi:acetyl-CoA carboxylase carboxyl transferase subunit beta
MNWLTNFVRPRIKRLVAPREAPDNLWLKCPSCNEMVFHRELEKSFRVCPHCDHHMRLAVKDRLELMFDEKKWTEIELPSVPADPLKFKDRKKYTDRLKESRTKTGLKDAVVVAHGTMGGINVVVAVFEFGFLGGSMGTAVGEAIVASAELAILQESPLIVIPSSGGARMQEGILSLMQMARTTVAIDRVREKGLPYIVLLTDPTTGGVTASFAMLGDVHIAEPGASIGFAGARVIEQTIRETLPPGFQKSEYLLDHGMVDMVVHREDMRETLVQLLGLLLHRDPAAPVISIEDGERRARRGRRTKEEKPATVQPPDPSIPDDSLFESDDDDGKS